MSKYSQQVKDLAVELLPLLVQHSTKGEGNDSLTNYVHPIKALNGDLIEGLTCDRKAWARIMSEEHVDEIYNSDVLIEAYKASEQQLEPNVYFKSLDPESCYAVAQFGAQDPYLFLLFYKEFPPDQIDTGKWLLNSVFTGRRELCSSDPSWSEKFGTSDGHSRTRSLDSDGSYWDQYGAESDREEGDSKRDDEEEQTDEEYYARYNTVETSIGDGGGQEKVGGGEPLELHINETLASLSKLALSSGMSKTRFAQILMKHAMAGHIREHELDHL